MKRVLIIAYYYPPLLDVGTQRTIGFVRYLPQFGWDPYVVSVKNPDPDYCILGNAPIPDISKTFYVRSLINLYKITGKANGLLSRILSIFKIKITKNIFQDLFCIPDIFWGWIPLSFLISLKIIKKYKIDAIYVSVKPFSSAITGVLLKKITGKPLILDFRDPVSFLSLKGINQKLNSLWLKRIIIKKLEKFVLGYTDEFIVLEKGMKKDYLKLYPFLSNKINVIYNGFYPEDLPKNKPEYFNKFTIFYAGNFYLEWIKPDLIFKSLSIIKEQRLIPESEIRFLYLGIKGKWLNDLITKYKLENIIECPGYVSKKEALENTFKASLPFLRLPRDGVGTKIFEGLAAGKRFLATIQEGEATDLLRRYSKKSYIINTDNPELVVDAIMDAYGKWKNGELIDEPEQEYLENFNKRKLTHDLVETLDETQNETF